MNEQESYTEYPFMLLFILTYPLLSLGYNINYECNNVIEKNSMKFIKNKKTDVMPFTNSKPYCISITSNDYSARTNGNDSDQYILFYISIKHAFSFPVKSPNSTYGSNTITTTSAYPSSIPSTLSGTAIHTADKRYSGYSDVDPCTYPNRQSFVSSSTKPVAQILPVSKKILLHNSQELGRSKSNSPTMGRTFSSLPNLLQNRVRHNSSNPGNNHANSVNLDHSVEPSPINSGNVNNT